MHIGFTSHLVAQVRLVRVIPSMHVHLCLASCLFSPRLSCSLPRLTVLLPALPDVHLCAQREVQVQPPVRLPLGDRGHIRLRDTPHNKRTFRRPQERKEESRKPTEHRDDHACTRNPAGVPTAGGGRGRSTAR